MDKYVIISPYSQRLPSGKPNAKNFPHWNQVVSALRFNGYKVVQIGKKFETELEGINEFKVELDFEELKRLLEGSAFWLSVDNFFQHFSAYHRKKGIAIFAKSDPKLFGHESNINLYKNEKYFRNDQFSFWFDEPYVEETFVSHKEVLEAIKKNFDPQFRLGKNSLQ